MLKKNNYVTKLVYQENIDVIFPYTFLVHCHSICR